MDDRVCKSHLLDCCPHDILSGTRMDLGECNRIHDLALRADFEIASKHQEYFFELDVSCRESKCRSVGVRNPPSPPPTPSLYCRFRSGALRGFF
ncbi:UNVERIFIED_CONTAM: hypothetical protein FKN15_026478 [Acipenser sinensis]